jgi:Domain of unknown function (DUF4331)
VKAIDVGSPSFLDPLPNGSLRIVARGIKRGSGTRGVIGSGRDARPSRDCTGIETIQAGYWRSMGRCSNPANPPPAAPGHRKRESIVSHHFDTDQAKNDPRLNCCDVYLFQGRPGHTVMVMTSNADAGISSPDAFHPEGLYALRIDTDGDAKENVIFKFRFGEPRHARGDEHRHVQSFKVIRADTGQIAGIDGEVIAEGETGTSAEANGVRVHAGLAPELWAADALAFFTTLTNLFSEDKYDRATFQNRQNLFQNRNVMAIVIEVPNAMLGKGQIGVWATISLFGHAPEVQICRWGYPLTTHLFLSNPSTPELTAKYHAGVPAEDVKTIGPAIAAFAARLSSKANPKTDADTYGERIAAMLCPSLLPYEVGTQAKFSTESFNGRSLTDDAYDVMLSLATNTEVHDGVAPNHARTRSEFPYYGAPFTKQEQAGLQAIQGNIGYGSDQAKNGD